MAKFKNPVGGLSNLAGKAGGGVKSVQEASTSGGNNNSTETATINSVDVSQTIVIPSFIITTNTAQDWVYAELVDSTTVRWTAYNEITDKCNAEIVEFDGIVKSMQRGIMTIPGGNTSATKTITSVDTSKTLVNHLGSTFVNSNSFPSQRHVASIVRLLNATTIEAEIGYDNGTDVTVSYEVVEFK